MDIFLNDYENQITNDYLKYRTAKLTDIERDLIEEAESRFLFTPHVFRMIFPEVVSLMVAHGVSYDTLYPEIIKQARYTIRRDRLYSDNYNLPLSVATFIIWLDFCCDYKKYGKVCKLRGDEWGYRNNKKDLELVVFSYCMNYGFGYATGKAQKLQNVFVNRIDVENIVKREPNSQNYNEIVNELNAFWELMHSAGFYYTKG